MGRAAKPKYGGATPPPTVTPSAEPASRIALSARVVGRRSLSRASVAGGQRFDGELGLGEVAVTDGRAGGGGVLQVAGEEVGMEVGLDVPLDAQAGGLGVGQVLRDVPLRVDDHGPAGRLVADQVAEEGETPELVLAEEHRFGLPCGDPHSISRHAYSEEPYPAAEAG